MRLVAHSKTAIVLISSDAQQSVKSSVVYQAEFRDIDTQLHPFSATCHWGTHYRDLSLQQYVLESRELKDKIRGHKVMTWVTTYEQTLWSSHVVLLDLLGQVGRSH
jgi:hypothetical protein